MASEVELHLTPRPIAATLARAAVAAIGSPLPEAVMRDAELLTSEVVTNAVTHGASGPSDELTVRVVADGYVRVEVVDPGPPFDVDAAEPAPRPGGWGLFLVDTLATAWGIDPEGAGKRVWFEIGQRPSGAA